MRIGNQNKAIGWKTSPF